MVILTTLRMTVLPTATMGQTGSLAAYLLEPARGSTVRTDFMVTSTTGMILTMVTGVRYLHAALSRLTTSMATKLGMGKDMSATLATAQVRNMLSLGIRVETTAAVIRAVETAAAVIRVAETRAAVTTKAAAFKSKSGMRHQGASHVAAVLLPGMISSMCLSL